MKKIFLLLLISHVQWLSGQDAAALGRDSVNTAILENVMQNNITQHDIEQNNENLHIVDELSLSDVHKTLTHIDDTNVAIDAVTNIKGQQIKKDPQGTVRHENRIDEFFRSHPKENIVRQAMLDVVTRMSTVGIVEETLSRSTDDNKKQATDDKTDMNKINNEMGTVESNTIDKNLNDVATIEFEFPNHSKEIGGNGEEIIESTTDQTARLVVEENSAFDMATTGNAEYTESTHDSAKQHRQPPLNDDILTEFESDVATMSDKLLSEHNTASNEELVTEDSMTVHYSNDESEELFDHIASSAIIVENDQIDATAIKDLKEENILDEEKVENHSIATMLPATLETSVEDVITVKNTENSINSKQQASQSSSVDIGKLIDVKRTSVDTLPSNETAANDNATTGMNMEWSEEDENLDSQPKIGNFEQAEKDKVDTDVLVRSDTVPLNTINTVFSKLETESTKTLQAALHEPDDNLVKDGDNNAAFFQGRKRVNKTSPIEIDHGNDDGPSFVNIDSVLNLESLENVKNRLEQDSFEMDIDSPIERDDGSNKRYFQDLIRKFHNRIKLSNLFDLIDADFEDDTPTQILRRPAAADENLLVQNATNGADDNDDDRTLLDIFAESAKEFLTKKMFKETDPNCDWEWRSLRCEPALYCSFQYLMGDYHFGRSCRRKPRRLRSTNVTRISNVQATVLRPLSNAKQGRNRTRASFREISISDRIASLVKQTGEICLHKAKDVVDHFVNLTESKSAAMKQNFLNKREQTCQHLWTTATALNREKQKHDDFCFEANLVPLPTIRERILCGQLPDFPVCEDEEFNEFWKS